MALPTRHREPTGDASACLAVARVRVVAISLDDQPHRRRGHHRCHGPRGHFICLAHPRSNPLLQLPYQTPPSTLTRTVIKYLTRSDATFARSLRSFIGSFPSIKHPGWILRRLHSGVHSVLKGFRCVPAVGEEAEQVSLAIVVTPPARVFKDISINWEMCKADIRCIFWVLDSTTDTDVISSTVRFAADTIWYPEIAKALSPHILADLFFDCLVDGRVIPGKSEHASSIGMALASVLSIQLGMESEDEGLRELCERVLSQVQWERSPEPMFLLVLAVLKLVARAPTPDGSFVGWELFQILDRSSIAHKHWLSRVMLQTIWRRSCVRVSAGILYSWEMGSMCQILAADGNQMPNILKINLFLILAISLGLQIDIHDLYAPNNKCVTFLASPLTLLIEQQ